MALWNKWFGKSRKTQVMEAVSAQETARAKRLAEAAMTPKEDSEAAKLARDRRLKRLNAGRGLGGTDVGAAGGGRTASKTLLGA